MRLTALILLVAAAGCGGPATSPPPSSEGGADPGARKVIGASLLTGTHRFYQDMSAALEEAAEKNNLALQIQYCEFDGAKQNDQLETFIVKGVDAIILSPTDSAGVRPVISEARAKGIPVFTVDIGAHGAEVVCHIASDNVQGGRIIGEYLAKQLEGKGTVAIVDHPETASVQDRVAGFEEALSAYPDIRIVAKVPGGGKRDVALQATQDLLQAHPDLSAIFGINDDSALGALAAVEAAGRQDKIVIVGYDGTPEARDTIIRGKALKADTVQYPEAIGRKAIEIVAAHFRGEQVPEQVPVDVGLIDRESLQKEGA